MIKLVIKLLQLIMDSCVNFLSYQYFHWYKDKLLLCELQKSVEQKEGPPKKQSASDCCMICKFRLNLVRFSSLKIFSSSNR